MGTALLKDLGLQLREDTEGFSSQNGVGLDPFYQGNAVRECGYHTVAGPSQTWGAEQHLGAPGGWITRQGEKGGKGGEVELGGQGSTFGRGNSRPFCPCPEGAWEHGCPLPEKGERC